MRRRIHLTRGNNNRTLLAAHIHSLHVVASADIRASRTPVRVAGAARRRRGTVKRTPCVGVLPLASFSLREPSELCEAEGAWSPRKWQRHIRLALSKQKTPFPHTPPRAHSTGSRSFKNEKEWYILKEILMWDIEPQRVCLLKSLFTANNDV